MGKAKLTDRLDQLYEFDREPVHPEQLKTPGKFAAIFSGEHVAATEFVIGPMFVIHGVAAADLFWGLLIGNLLAVLSWAFIVAPIAVRTRLTLYWYVRRICGPGLTFIYNSANAVLYCVLAGAMISVAATAIGLAFKVPVPALTDVLPSSVGWVVLTLIIGSVVTLVAILGFEQVSRFSSVCAPWMFAIFIAGALALLPRLGNVRSLSDFWQVANQSIWTGIPLAGQEKYHFWHITFFAWSANLAMHVGLSDMALFRFAKIWKYGFLSAFGMYPGHFLAWICSGIMVAAAAREMNPGGMAYMAAGFSGALCVVVAGWTTANPTMYRAGLALQAATPNWKRWRVTLAAGLLTTVVSCFPVVFMRLMDFVALYGLILMPIGAVIFAEHWLLPRLGLLPYRAEQQGWFINWMALITWIVTLIIVALLPIHLFFRWLPGYLFAQALYLLLCWLEQTRKGKTA